MSSFSFDQFAIDFSEYLDLFNIRPETTYKEIAVAIRAVKNAHDGEAHFDHKEAEAYFRAYRDYLKRLTEMWLGELAEDFLETAPNVEQEAVLELVCPPRVIDDFWMEDEDTDD